MVSKIEWTDETWNPVTGCSKVSAGCAHCYAERVSKRFGWDFDQVTLHPDRLEQPLRWRKPRRVFVNSMSDLFHEDVPDDFIREVLQVACATPQHTYQILTKRPERMRDHIEAHGPWEMLPAPHPLPNVWLGVSVENQETADERIPHLLQTPAAVRFVSYEPALGPVDFRDITIKANGAQSDHINALWCEEHPEDDLEFHGATLDWVICGGESGPKARPMHPDWARSVRDQCQAAGTAFFFKQWGEEVKPSQMPLATYRDIEDNGRGIGITDNPRRVGKKRAGRLLDGREWNEFPGADISVECAGPARG